MDGYAQDNDHPSLQKPNRTLLPKSPFFKGGLLKQFLVVPPFDKGGLGGILVFEHVP